MPEVAGALRRPVGGIVRVCDRSVEPTVHAPAFDRAVTADGTVKR